MVMIFIVIYLYFRLYSKCDNITLSDKRLDVVVSLTTTPDRIHTSKNTIISLLKQEYLPKEILFNIPYVSCKGKEYIIPDWLSNLSRKYPVLVLNRCEKDYGPITKLIPTLLRYENNPNQKIIYVDDDVIWSKNMVYKLYKQSEKYPDYVLTGSGEKVSTYLQIKKMADSMKKYCPISPEFLFDYKFRILLAILLVWFLIWKEKWLILLILLSLILLFVSIRKKETKNVDLVMGISGVLVYVKNFDIPYLLQQDNYPKDFFFADDIYISGHLSNNNVKKLKVSHGVGLHNIHEQMFQGLNWNENLNNHLQTVAKSTEYFNWN